ncbi:MAG: EAL domain-containing protein, partial [Thermodesulfobacteriota bacterium]
MSITKKLLLGLIAVAMIIGLMAYVVVDVSRDSHRSFERIARETLPLMEALADVKVAGLRIVASTSEYGFIKAEQGAAAIKNTVEAALPEKAIDAEEELIAEGINEYESALKRCRMLVKRYYPEHREYLTEIVDAGNDLQRVSKEIVALKAADVSGLEVLKKKLEFEEAERRFVSAVEASTKYAGSDFTRKKEHTLNILQSAATRISWVAIVLVILSLLLGLFLARAIIRPIRRLKKTVDEFGRGNLDARVEIISNDETALLAKTFNQMADNLQKTTVSRDLLFKEIEERRLTEEALKESKQYLARAQEIAHIGHWKLNPKTNEITGSHELYRIFGLNQKDKALDSFVEVVHPEDKINYVSTIRKGIESGDSWNLESRLICSDRTKKWILSIGESITDERGKTSLLVGTVQDITDRKESEEKMEYLAYHDHLTGLPNRSLLIEHLVQALAIAQRDNKGVAILFIDIDRFKLINDTMGHITGDEVLQAVTKRLKKCLRKYDTLARQGGDEFILLVQKLERPEDIKVIAKRILSVFKAPFECGKHSFSITVSFGVSIYPHDGEDAEALLKNADTALYSAKDEGKNTYRLYDTGMHKDIANKLALENKLRRALENEEFLLHYQPQVEAANGEVNGIEALVRWQNPEEGLISPAEFIPVAEDTRLIIPMGEWILRTACTQNRMWQESGLKDVSMAVNISMHQFKQKDFVATIERILKETGLEPKYLELELTESIVMADVDATIEKLHAFKEMGVRLSIDDFGTGYSSLSYLKKFPLDVLKIDISFIRDIPKSKDDI